MLYIVPLYFLHIFYVNNNNKKHDVSARYSYENCVYNSAWSKCNAKSAKFTKSIVELLSSERQFKNCAKIEKTLCSDGSSIFHGFNMIMYLLCSSSILSGMLLIRQL